MVTALLAGIALAAPELPDDAPARAWSLETRYASAFGPDAWGTARLRAEAAPGLEVGAMAIGGTRAAVLASVGRSVRLGEVATWRGELLVGMRRTAVDEPGGPLAGFETGLVIHAAPAVDGVGTGGWLPGIGGWFEGGVDARAGAGWAVHPRLHAGTWAGDRDLALRVELGGSHAWASGWFVRAAAGAGGRDTVHLGPGAALSVGRSS